MKIAAFMGSPRRQGNTDLLLDRLLAAAEAAGAETEKIHVCDLDIRGCVRLALSALYQSLKDFDLRRVDAAYIDTTHKRFTKMPVEEMEQLFADIKAKTKPARKRKAPKKEEPEEPEEGGEEKVQK